MVRWIEHIDPAMSGSDDYKPPAALWLDPVDVSTLLLVFFSTPRPHLDPVSPAAPVACLDPCCIHIDEKRTIIPSGCAHFGTARPDGPYNQLPGLQEANVRLNIKQIGRERIAKHYAFMQHKRLCEDEFATFAKETFFKGESREIEPPKDRHWRAERMLQLVCPPPEDAHWSPPPVLLPEIRYDDYRWDIRPDCTYWLSLRGFNSEYSFCVKPSLHEGHSPPAALQAPKADCWVHGTASCAIARRVSRWRF